MSYMNDDTDPFGVPYNVCTSNNTTEKEEYSFKDLKELREKELELNTDLAFVKRSKEEAIDELKLKIQKIASPYAKIECDKNCNWKIITPEFNLSDLEKLKEKFGLKDIHVKCSKVENDFGKYVEKIIIRLILEDLE